MANRHMCGRDSGGQFHTNQLCDGVAQCADQRDEKFDFANSVFGHPQIFECIVDGRCIKFDQHCDGRPDCKAATDETECTRCSIPNFKCFLPDQCIERALVCDGSPDCGDGSDELYCTVRGDGSTSRHPPHGSSETDIEETSQSVSMIVPIAIAGFMILMLFFVCCVVLRKKKQVVRNNRIRRLAAPLTSGRTTTGATNPVPNTMSQVQDNRAFVADLPPSYQEVMDLKLLGPPPTYDDYSNNATNGNSVGMAVSYISINGTADIQVPDAQTLQAQANPVHNSIITPVTDGHVTPNLPSYNAVTNNPETNTRLTTELNNHSSVV